MLSCDVLYSAFDVFPGTKGTQAHIARNVESITSFAGRVTLACLGFDDMPSYQVENNVTIRRFKSMHPNFLKRAHMYADFLDELPSRMRTLPRHIHFRDIWSGIPLLHNPSFQSSIKIFECNGVPSLELATHYPALRENRALLQRIRRMEDDCLAASDRIITVSAVTARYLESRGVSSDIIHIIPNMAHLGSGRSDRPTGVYELDELINNKIEYVLYTGVLSDWQGIDTLIRAFSLVRSENKIKLVIAASNNKFQKQAVKDIATHGLSEDVILSCALAHESVMRLFSNALFTVAPLARGERNELQGACPVKIVESMANGTPVVASNLAISRELIDHGRDGWLVTPDSPRSLAAGISQLLRDRALLLRLGKNALIKASGSFAMDRFTQRLKAVYGISADKGGTHGIEHTA